MCNILKSSEIYSKGELLIYVEKIGPFMDAGYFNILHRTDTENKEKPLKIAALPLCAPRYFNVLLRLLCKDSNNSLIFGD